MAEEKAPVRSSVEIQTKYAELCGIAGDKQYRVQSMQAELDNINSRLYRLNGEYEEAVKREADAKAESAKVVEVVPEAMDANESPAT